MQQHLAPQSSAQSPARTPTQILTKSTMMITEAQKQALMDNLQLEVTDRARKLRAQYTLQAQSLRTRIELRLNRIPHSLRNTNIGELSQKYQEAKRQTVPQVASSEAETEKPAQSKLPAKEDTKTKKITEVASPRPRGIKRTSEQIENADKENTPDPTQNLPNPKKRSKMAANAPSRQVTNPSTVLSPKSSNSRTLPQSPVRPTLGSPQKNHLSRPVSPLKPLSPSKQFTFSKPVSPAKSAAIAATTQLTDMVAEKPKATRGKATAGRKTGTTAPATKAASTRSKRGMDPPPVPDLRTVSSQSTVSTTSNATTVIKKGPKAQAATTAAAQKKKAANPGVSAAGKEVVDTPPLGRRVLRKRA